MSVGIFVFLGALRAAPDLLAVGSHEILDPEHRTSDLYMWTSRTCVAPRFIAFSASLRTRQTPGVGALRSNYVLMPPASTPRTSRCPAGAMLATRCKS